MTDTPTTMDLKLAQWLQNFDQKTWIELLRFASYLTDKPAGPSVFVAIVLALWLGRLRVEAILLVLAQNLYFVQLSVKQIVQRPRPTADLISIYEISDGFAFPSTHTTMGVALYGTLVIIALARLERGQLRNVVVLASCVILILATISRPTLGAHWPSDAVGSLLLGGVWMLMITKLYVGMRQPSGLPELIRRLSRN